MPRVIQTIDSDEHLRKERDGEEDDVAEEAPNQESLDTVNSGLTRNSVPRTTNSSQDRVAFKDHDDEDDDDEEIKSPLRVILNGKVQKFKKDSRVWLHKSSERAARNIQNALRQEAKMNSQKASDKKNNNPEAMDIGDEEDKDNNRLKATIESDSNVTFEGDSDADLAYSEDDSDQSSSTEISSQLPLYHTEISFSEERIDMDVDEDSGVKECAAERSQTFSGSENHSVTCTDSCAMSLCSRPTDQELSRKFAPAIDMEEESFKESLLDYALNHFGNHLTEKRKPLSGKPYNMRKGKRKRRPSVDPSACECPYVGFEQQQRRMYEGREDLEEILKDIRRRIASSPNSEENNSVNANTCADITASTERKEIPSLLLSAGKMMYSTNVKKENRKGVKNIKKKRSGESNLQNNQESNDEDNSNESDSSSRDNE